MYICVRNDGSKGSYREDPAGLGWEEPGVILEGEVERAEFTSADIKAR